MRKTRQRQSGFTLVEVILYIALTTSFMGILTKVFLDTLDVKKDTQSTSAVEQDARFLISRMMYDVVRADSVLAPSLLGEVSDTLVFVSSGTTYTYLVNGQGVLGINESGVFGELTGPDTIITNISFTRLGNAGGIHSFQVVFDIESTIQETSGVEQRSFQTTLGLR